MMMPLCAALMQGHVAVLVVLVCLAVFAGRTLYRRLVGGLTARVEAAAAHEEEQETPKKKQVKTQEKTETSLEDPGLRIVHKARATDDDETSTRSTIVITVNGVVHRVENPSPRTTLLSYLREELGLTGAKIGCGEGGCGACTVVEDDSRAINSCLRLLVACDGLSVTTVEGLGSSKSTFSDEQIAIADGNGSQCGFCTPGWSAAMHGLRREFDVKGKPLTAKDIEKNLDGNICRCTGYRPIVAAFKSKFAEEPQEALDDIETCGVVTAKGACTNSNNNNNTTIQCRSVTTGRKCGRACDAYAAKIQTGGPAVTATDVERNVTYVAPTSLPELYAALDSLGYDTPVLVGGTTAAIGVAKYYDDALAPWQGGLAPANDARLVATKTVPELSTVNTDDDGTLRIGSAVTIATLIDVLEGFPDDPARAMAARHLSRVANAQVRNSATWAGNLILLANAKNFISDVVAAFNCLDAVVEVSSVSTTSASKKKKNVKARATTTTRATSRLSADALVFAVRNGDLVSPVVLSVSVPPTKNPNTTIIIPFADKVAARHANAHAVANCGLSMTVDVTTGTVSAASCLFGGLDPDALMFSSVASPLIGISVTDPDSLNAAMQSAVANVRAASVAKGPDAYEADLCVAFIYKWFLAAQTTMTGVASIPASLQSAAISLAVDRPETNGAQDIDGAEDASHAPASMPRTKLAARLQASGEAVYCTDVPCAKNELWAHFAFSRDSAGALNSVSTTDALRVPGCVAIITASDLIAKYGAVATLADADDPLLYAVGDSVFVGARVAIAVATSYEAAIEAARAVNVSVDASKTSALAPRLVDPGPALAAHFEDAKITFSRQAPKSRSVRGVAGKWKRLGLPRRGLERDSANKAIRMDFVNPKKKKKNTTAKKRLQDDDVVTVEETVQNQFFKHFHMETHAARCVPQEGGCLEVWSSSQDNALAQATIAAALGVASNKIVVKCRRAGGGFGAKLSLHLAAACATAVVTDMRGAPCRVHAERRDDMKITGGREACETKYTLTADKTTMKMQTYEVTFTLTGGAATDDSTGDLSMAVAWSDNCYKAEQSHHAIGHAVKSAAPRNTSMRSPGVLQSHCAHELAMVQLADALNQPVHAVQEANFYRDGDATPYGYTLGENGFNWSIPQLWDALKPTYLDKLSACETFNAANQYKKRGVHMSPTKYIMGLDGWKIPALVVIYADASVEVTTGGCEIGQGLYTKVAACAAYALGCPLDVVRVGDTATDKTPNSTCTGGSGTSESACNAAMLACQTLKARLAPYVGTDDAPVAWADAVAAALGDNVELAATGWNNVETDTSPQYATYGVGLAEVEVDVLTGEVSVVEMTIHMDQGTSLNPTIDLGQVEGGVVIALGFYFTEVNLIDAAGKQTGDGTWEYKPPMLGDIPLTFNVSMLANTPNPSPVAVLNSKASGEPPMQLASAMWLAARSAVAAARKSLAGNDDWFTLPIPATPESIRQACLLDDTSLSLTTDSS